MCPPGTIRNESQMLVKLLRSQFRVCFRRKFETGVSVGEALCGQGQGWEEQSGSRDSRVLSFARGLAGGSGDGYQPQDEVAVSRVCSTVISFDPEFD